MRNEDMGKLSSQFLDRLASLQPLEVAPTLCAWSDLLGFGRTFTDSGWCPSAGQWRLLAGRIDQAYRLHLQNLCVGDFVLLLNDGVVRTITLSMPDSWVGWAAFWMRHVVKAHVEVNSAERAMGLPGTRTVVAAGERASYAFPEVRLQDLKYYYTRPHGAALDTSRSADNPLLVSNPQPLQLNTAFSKAYLLDSYGSSKGIRGAGFFVDASVFEALRSCSRNSQTVRFVEEDRGMHWFYGVRGMPVEPGSRSGLLGFLCETPSIEVREKLLSTTVQKVVRYFPDDEDWDAFSFDLT